MVFSIAVSFLLRSGVWNQEIESEFKVRKGELDFAGSKSR
jgi:hypothetical protein